MALTREQIINEVISLVEDQSGISFLANLDAKLTDYGLDDLDEIEIVMSLEEAFDCEIDLDHLNNYTLRDIVDLVEECTGTVSLKLKKYKQ